MAMHIDVVAQATAEFVHHAHNGILRKLAATFQVLKSNSFYTPAWVLVFRVDSPLRKSA